MAKKTIEIVTSDVSGVELESGRGETIYFSLGGSSYSLDLTASEAEDFRTALDPWVSAATKTSSRTTSPRKSSASGRSPEELAHIRSWARDKGHEVSERGRIKTEILEAFDAAQR